MGAYMRRALPKMKKIVLIRIYSCNSLTPSKSANYANPYALIRNSVPMSALFRGEKRCEFAKKPQIGVSTFIFFTFF